MASTESQETNCVAAEVLLVAEGEGISTVTWGLSNSRQDMGQRGNQTMSRGTRPARPTIWAKRRRRIFAADQAEIAEDFVELVEVLR